MHWFSFIIGFVAGAAVSGVLVYIFKGDAVKQMERTADQAKEAVNKIKGA